MKLLKLMLWLSKRVNERSKVTLYQRLKVTQPA